MSCPCVYACDVRFVRSFFKLSITTPRLELQIFHSIYIHGTSRFIFMFIPVFLFSWAKKCISLDYYLSCCVYQWTLRSIDVRCFTGVQWWRWSGRWIFGIRVAGISALITLQIEKSPFSGLRKCTWVLTLIKQYIESAAIWIQTSSPLKEKTDWGVVLLYKENINVVRSHKYIYFSTFES